MKKSIIELLNFENPEDYIVHAARTCYDSHFTKDNNPRTEEENQKLLRHLIKSGHLTTSEHARFNLVMPVLSYNELEGLAYMPVHPTYRRYGMRKDTNSLISDYSIMGLNITHIRNMCTQSEHWHLNEFGHSLAHYIKQFTPTVLGDIVTDGIYSPLVHVLPDSEMSRHQLLVFKNYSFHVTGSRSLGNQLVRHRLLSQDQRSQRYCDEGEFDVIRPPEAPVNSREEAYTGLPTGSGYFDMDYWSEQLQGVYKLLRKEGWTKGAARCILPNAAVTQLVVTGNMQGIRHFLKLRCASDAQPEIRYIAVRMHQLIGSQHPELVEDIEYSTKDIEKWLE